MDACSSLLLFLAGLTVVAVVGHGLWSLAVVILRGLSRSHNEDRIDLGLRPRTGFHCDECGQALALWHVTCPRCGLSLNNERARELAGLETARRQLRACVERGELDEETIARVLESLAARQEMLQATEPRRRRPVRDLHPVPSSAPPAGEEEILDAIPVPDLQPHAPAGPAASADVVVPEPPRLPRRSFGELLAAFMEERNILWGEIVGGLLIVGCSIALVLSLWRTLEEVPYFPFLVFAGITTALFGAGLYTLYHWKLEATSRGLLVIATLLVPLNFLVMAGLARPGGDWIDLALQAAALGVFALLLWPTARVFVPDILWPLPLAVLGASAVQFLVPQLLTPGASTPWLPGLLGFLPVAFFGGATVSLLARLGRAELGPCDERRARMLFAYLGMASFALVVALGFLVYWSQQVVPVLEVLSVVVATAGMPLLASGLFVHRGLTSDSSSGEGAENRAGLRTVGTTVALVGVAVMLAALGLAWPRPEALVFVSALDFVVLSYVALRYQLPVAHAAAMPCLVIGSLTSFHAIAGHLTEPFAPSLARWALDGSSGLALAAITILFLGTAELFLRRRLRAPGHIYLMGAAVTAACSLHLVTLGSEAHAAHVSLVYGLYTVLCLAENLRWRRWPLGGAGAALLLGCLFYGITAVADGSLAWRWLIALLLHASVVLVPALSSALPASFSRPWRGAALVTSSLALIPLALVLDWQALEGPAWCLAWLAAVWLVHSTAQRWPALFAASQVVLFAAAGCGVSAWLRGQPWGLGPYPESLLDPRSLHAYGLALAAVCCCWAVARHLLRTGPKARLLHSGWPAVDQVVLAGLLVGQLVVAAWAVWPVVVRELIPRAAPANLAGWPAEHMHAFDTEAWVVLAALAVVLAIMLWDDFKVAAVAGLLLLASTAPLLAAGPLAGDRATIPGLCWGFATCYVVCALPLWVRGMPGRLAGSLNESSKRSRGLIMLAQGGAIAGAVLPLVCLTTARLIQIFEDPFAEGPAAESWFARPGPSYSTVGPLVVLGLAFTVYGLRERSAGYAFAAGLVLNCAGTLGHALSLVLGGRGVDAIGATQLLQTVATSAGAWAVAWLAVRPWLLGGKLPVDSLFARPLLIAQLGLGVLGSALLLLLGLVGVVFVFPEREPGLIEVGSPMTWLAFLLTTAAVAIDRRQRRAGSWPAAAAVAGMAAIGFLACSCACWPAGWEYQLRVLMNGWAGLALVAALAGWWSSKGQRNSLFDENAGAVLWIAIAAGLAGYLGIWAALRMGDHLWSASAIALASAAGAVLAVWRRREGWAFASGLGINLAASLVVWHFHRLETFATWWLPLVQANVVASASFSMLWSALRRQIDPRAARGMRTGSLLTAYVFLCTLAQAALLVWCFIELLQNPSGPWPDALLWVGYAPGWLALVWSAAALLVFINEVAPRARIHFSVVLGWAVAVLSACTLASWDVGNWLSYHVLLVLCALSGAVLLAFERAGLLGRARTARPSPELWGWMGAVCVLVPVLALRSAWSDPARPWWSGAALLALFVQVVCLTLWERSAWLSELGSVGARLGVELGEWTSGALLILTGFLAWLAWEPSSFASFFATTVICLTVGSAFWTVVQLIAPAQLDCAPARRSSLTFRHTAILVGLEGLALLVVLRIGLDLAGETLLPLDALTWAAFGAVVMGLLLSAWDRQARFTLGGLYVSGLLLLGLGLREAELAPEHFVWFAALGLAGLVLLGALLYRVAPMLTRLGARLKLPARPGGWPVGWFLPTQLALAGVILAASVWMTLSFDSLADREAGALVAVILFGAGLLLTSAGQRGRAELLRILTLGLGVAAVAESACALVGPDWAAPWLHRNVALMVTLALMTGLYGVGLRRLLPWAEWVESGRRLGPVLGVLASLCLLGIIGQEFRLFDPAVQRTPMAVPAVVLVTIGLLGLIAALIGFAVLPGRDPLGLSVRGRTLYIYASEFLLYLLFVHLRLNVPALHHAVGPAGPLSLANPTGAFYWTLIVMALAYIGVGLSEYFKRRGLAVLAEPLQRTGMFLPLLPLLAFWARPPAELGAWAEVNAPGFRVLLDSLYRFPHHFGQHAFLWFSLSLLYALVAIGNRSFRFAVLAALAANFGLWALWAHEGIEFLHHPQLWLIPLAVIVLVAEQLNRDRLTLAQAATLRYMALTALYLSSTADMFIAGLGNSVILPIVLAVLSVAGVLTGILLRVRAFLFLGVAFLFLVVFSQIWHAAVDREQTWVWWASGIVLGAAILTLFAIFEKRRHDLLRLLEDLRRWQ